MDVDNVRWNNADIFLTTNKTEDDWKDSKFKKKIFSKHYLCENFRANIGVSNRKNVYSRKQEQIDMISRGYSF